MSLFAPGEIWRARMEPVHKRPETAHKTRPVVLVRQRGNVWDVVALTRLTRYSSGAKRSPVPGWETTGLDSQPYLWSPRLMILAATAINGEYVGRATPEMVEGLVALLDLHPRFVTEMLETA